MVLGKTIEFTVRRSANISEADLLLFGSPHSAARNSEISNGYVHKRRRNFEDLIFQIATG